MSKKKPLYGASNYIKEKPRKRPKRHSKSPNKSTKRQKKRKYRGQGRGWQTSYKILYYPCNLNYPIMELFKLHFVNNK